jgi:hypothetical protein
MEKEFFLSQLTSPKDTGNITVLLSAMHLMQSKNVPLKEEPSRTVTPCEEYRRALLKPAAFLSQLVYVTHSFTEKQKAPGRSRGPCLCLCGT